MGRRGRRGRRGGGEVGRARARAAGATGTWTWTDGARSCAESEASPVLCRPRAAPAARSVHYVSQEVQLSDESKEWTPAEVVVHADVERRLLLAEAAELSAEDADAAAAQRLNDVQERLQAIDADTAVERANTLLVNLGFSAELRGRKMAALSGGWRVRTALAAAIFARPDLLLLDEPTNHLSIGAVLWLARELKTSEAWQQRTIVVVSHDRVFLDETCTDTLHVSGAARQVPATLHPATLSPCYPPRLGRRAAGRPAASLRGGQRSERGEGARDGGALHWAARSRG